MLYNESLSGSAVAAAANISANTYSSFQLVSAFPILLGAVAILTILYSIIFCPKYIKRLLYGYVLLGTLGVMMWLCYILLMSLKSIGNFIVNGVFNTIGNFIITYWVYIIVTLPLAYLVGVKFEQKIDSE